MFLFCSLYARSQCRWKKMRFYWSFEVGGCVPNTKRLGRPLSRPRLQGNGRPAQLLPVVRRHPDTGLPTQDDLRWGLIPHTAKRRPDIQPIHARAESVAENRMFRDAYRSRRCVVPMNAFFLKDAAGKRHAFTVKDTSLFGVAGIWENWRDPDTRQWERTFATITVAGQHIDRSNPRSHARHLAARGLHPLAWAGGRSARPA